ncbi:unnamed protein product [Brassica oleracea var. botrytis]
MVVHLISPIARTLALIFISLPSLINTSLLDYDTLVFSKCDSSDTNILQKTTTTQYPNYSNHNLFLRAQALYSFLSKLESESSRAKFFKTLAGNDQHAVSGWFQCREDYPSEICHRCVTELRGISSRMCGNATSARVHLRGCHMVYEFEFVDTPTAPYNHHNYKLMETPERGLIHKICNGATAETFAGFEEMRTVAFTAAETGVVDGHGFYEESYKLMHVVAQCDGHVEACECGECVSAAAAAAAEECPWSIAGQIYLEGCYVGYTYNPHEYPGDSYHEEGGQASTGKSLAIVVGGVAALVLVAIFFLFLKSLRRKGDGTDLDMQPLILTDERVRKACETTRELKIPDEKTLTVLKKLLQENGENWTLIKLDNYTALIDAIYSLDEQEEEEEEEEDKKKNETSSNSTRGKHVFDSPPSGALKKQRESSSNRGKNVVVGTECSPATLKRKYETRSATSGSGSSTEEGQKQPQTSNGVVRKKKYKTIIRDITKGSESVEISLVDEVGTEQVPKFTYIPHNIVYQSAYLHVSLARISDDDCCASCKGDCLSADFPCACARETGGEYAYSKDGLLKEEFLDTCLKMKKAPDSFSKFYCQDCPLERGDGKCEGHLIRKFIKECWRKCGCDMMCGNRVVQRGIRCQLQVYFTQEGKGWGIRTLQDLPKGTFVCEYIGEILTNTELYERNIRSTSERHTYPVTLDADWGSEKDLKDEEALCLDATICGNVARFVNHR